MKNAVVLLLALSATAGCATMGATPNNQPVDDSSPGAASFPASMPAASSPNLGPSLVIPVTGGAPTLAIPLGGSLYLPVTGGPPVVGIPTSP